MNTLSPLQVLALYVAHGVRVRVNTDLGGNTFNKEGWLRSVINICNFNSLHPHRATVWIDGHDRDTDTDAAHLKPILKPFSALCEPLPDGTPAIRIAQRLWTQDPDGPWPNWTIAGTVDLTHETGDVWVQFTSYELANEEGEEGAFGELYNERLIIQPDGCAYWLMENAERVPVNATDLLRSMHFPVGLTADQYVTA